MFISNTVSVDEAKRFYPLFSQMGGLAPIVAGQYAARYGSKAADFGASLHRLTIATTLAGVGICLFYHLSTNLIEKEAKLQQSNEGGASVKRKKSTVKCPWVIPLKFSRLPSIFV